MRAVAPGNQEQLHPEKEEPLRPGRSSCTPTREEQLHPSSREERKPMEDGKESMPPFRKNRDGHRDSPRVSCRKEGVAFPGFEGGQVEATVAAVRSDSWTVVIDGPNAVFLRSRKGLTTFRCHPSHRGEHLPGRVLLKHIQTKMEWDGTCT